MKKTYLCFIFILLLLFGCSSKEESSAAKGQAPDAKELKNNLLLQLPGYYELTDFNLHVTENAGSEIRPLYKTKFKAHLKLKEDLFFMDNDLIYKYGLYPSDMRIRMGSSIAFLKKTGSSEDEIILYGMAVTQEQGRTWQIVFQFENDILESSGQPLNFFKYRTKVISGTESEEDFFKKLDEEVKQKENQRTEEEQKRIDAVQKQEEKRKRERQKRKEEAQLGNFKVYKFGNEPKLDNSPKNDKLIPTSNLTKNPFFIKSFLIDEKVLTTKESSYRRSGTRKYKSGVKSFYLRILLMNPAPEPYKNLYVSVHHYVYDIPHNVSGTYSASHRRDKVKVYTKKLYRLKKVPGKQKIVIDTEGIDLSFSEYKFIDDGWDRTHGYDDTYSSKTGEIYVGYIISIFNNKKLIYQQTNSRDLREFGIKKFNEAK